MANILLILTGGTIGSRIDQGGNISPSGEPLLLSLYEKERPESLHFTTVQPLCKLSENLTLFDREVIIKEILRADPDRFDGIIIAHGSDTLCYTAALVGMATRHIALPVVFIASDLVLSDPRSNGIDNLKSAVTFIENSGIRRGSYIAYRDKKGDASIYLATRLCSAEPLFDTFTPFDNARLGKTENGKFYLESADTNPTIYELNREKSQIFSEDRHLSDGVAAFCSSPGFDPNRFNTDGLSAVLNYGYHSATLDSLRFYPFAKDCESRGVDIILASFKDPSGPIYDSLSSLVALKNVKRLYNISPESALAKAVLAYSLDKKLLAENLFFENL